MTGIAVALLLLACCCSSSLGFGFTAFPSSSTASTPSTVSTASTLPTPATNSVGTTFTDSILLEPETFVLIDGSGKIIAKLKKGDATWTRSGSEVVKIVGRSPANFELTYTNNGNPGKGSAHNLKGSKNNNMKFGKDFFHDLQTFTIK